MRNLVIYVDKGQSTVPHAIFAPDSQPQPPHSAEAEAVGIPIPNPPAHLAYCSEAEAEGILGS